MAVYASDQADLLCSGSADKTVRLWDLRMAKCVDVIPSSSCVTSVCFNYGTTHSLLLASGTFELELGGGMRFRTCVGRGGVVSYRPNTPVQNE